MRTKEKSSQLKKLNKKQECRDLLRKTGLWTRRTKLTDDKGRNQFTDANRVSDRRGLRLTAEIGLFERNHANLFTF